MAQFEWWLGLTIKLNSQQTPKSKSLWSAYCALPCMRRELRLAGKRRSKTVHMHHYHCRVSRFTTLVEKQFDYAVFYMAATLTTTIIVNGKMELHPKTNKAKRYHKMFKQCLIRTRNPQ